MPLRSPTPTAEGRCGTITLPPQAEIPSATTARTGPRLNRSLPGQDLHWIRPEALELLGIDRDAEADAGGHVDLAVVHDDLLGDVLVEEPIRSGDVAGQGEPRK